MLACTEMLACHSVPIIVALPFTFSCHSVFVYHVDELKFQIPYLAMHHINVK